MLSASMEIMYSVRVVLRVLLAERRNFPFSTNRAGLKQRKRWNVSFDLSLLMKHWIIASRGPGCLRETGKVSFPQISGPKTISWHIALQDRQTEAQATTCFLAGQLLSLSSNLLITSKSNSGGRLAHLLVWTITGDKRSRDDEYSRNEEPWAFPLWRLESLKSKLLLDKLPNPSLKSWTMPRNDISLWFPQDSSQTRNAQIQKKELQTKMRDSTHF